MKIQRKYMAHYLNAHFASDSTDKDDYIRLGKDLEEYSPELSANVEKKSNILAQKFLDRFENSLSLSIPRENHAKFLRLRNLSPNQSDLIIPRNPPPNSTPRNKRLNSIYLQRLTPSVPVSRPITTPLVPPSFFPLSSPPRPCETFPLENEVVRAGFSQ